MIVECLAYRSAAMESANSVALAEQCQVGQNMIPNSTAGEESTTLAPSSNQSNFTDIPLSSPRPAAVAEVAMAPCVPSVGANMAVAHLPTSAEPDASLAGPSVAPVNANALIAPSTNTTNARTTTAHLTNPSISNPTSAPTSYVQSNTYSSAATLPHQSAGVVYQTSSVPAVVGTASAYEGINSLDGDEKLVPPPARPTPIPTSKPIPVDTKWTFQPITEAVAKEAFLKYANSKCCYPKAPAREMTVREFKPFNIYRYRLETFTESRACKWVTESYAGQLVDSSSYGTAPQPWDIPAHAPSLFKDGTHIVKVPHTASVQTCQKCMGLGRDLCLKCHGTSRVPCLVCNGTGRRMQMEMCQNCYGNGAESCSMCQQNNTPCIGCSGNGKMLSYIQLTVKWTNNVCEFIDEHYSDFPNELFKKAAGENIYGDEQEALAPLQNAQVSTINTVSQMALQQHHTELSSSHRVLKQRQTIEWMPLVKVDYTWKEKDFSYFVYGKDNQVHTASYPIGCCYEK
ncbi:protein SSUH2 homolog [Spea bombifrons]|uniref:protein SSUH2 homolog n=1 Tax=Spea bombifrons TaxID=233779 RepID=UPI00234BA42C|nr:protein SSUH2 homolog [Spea bombifrons]